MSPRVVIIEDRCKGCLLCTIACPKGIIHQGSALNRQGYKVAEVLEMDKCIGCASCALVCPDTAIRVFSTRKAKRD